MSKKKGDDGNARSVKAVVRVRPFLSRHLTASGVVSCLYGSPDNPKQIVVDQKIASALDQSVARDTCFAFDEVLWSVPAEQHGNLHPNDTPRPCASQEDCFAAVGIDAVDSVLSGSHACVLAYGQTGSGKSHTIFGPPENTGLALRAARRLFDFLIKSEKDRPRYFSYTVEIACFEIYNEKVSDLLVGMKVAKPLRRSSSRSPPSHAGESPPTDDDGAASMDSDLLPSSRRGASTGAAEQPMAADTKDLRVRSGPSGTAYVEGLRHELIDSPSAFSEVVALFLRQRTTASTLLNDTSSRSHAVLQLSVMQEDKVQGRRTEAVLHLVDLAGSERISRSGAVGSTLNEARHINLSLTALRRVIDVLVDNASGKKAQHIPIRDSVLTMLLADCFGGNAYTTMIATVSAHPDDVVDTISTLRYANKASSIVNYVKVNEEVITAVLVAVQQEVNHLRQALQEHSQPTNPAANRRRALTTTIGKRNSVLKLLEQSTNKKHELIHLNIAEEVVRRRSLVVEAASTVAALQSKQATAESLAHEIAAVKEATELCQQRLAREVEETNRVTSLIEAELQSIHDLEQRRIISQKEMFMAIRRRVWRRQFILAAEAERGRQQRSDLEEAVRQLRDELEKLTLLDEASQRDWADETHVLSAFREPEIRCRRIAKILADTYPVTYQSMKLLGESVERIQREIRISQCDLDVLDDQVHAARRQLLEQQCFNKHAIGIAEERVRDCEAAAAALETALKEHSRAHDQLTSTAVVPAEEREIEARREQNEDEESCEKELVDAIASVTAEAAEVAAENLYLNELIAMDFALTGVTELTLSDLNARVLRTENQVRSLKALIAESERVTRSWCFPDSTVNCSLPDDRLASLALAVNAPRLPRTKLELAKAKSRSPSPLVVQRLSGRRSTSATCSEPSPRRPSTGSAIPLGQPSVRSKALKLEQF